MTQLSKLIRSKSEMHSEALQLIGRLKEANFRLRVAEKEGVSEKINTAKAEVLVLAEMIEEIKIKIKNLEPEINNNKSNYKNKKRVITNNQFLFSFLILCSFLFEDKKFTFICILICIVILFVLQNKKGELDALEAGLSQEEINKIKKDAVDNLNKKDEENKRLASAIRDEFKK